MPRDGNGTYNAPEAPVVTNTPISSTSYNASLTDIGNALTQSLSADGQTVPTANLPMGTYRHTNVSNGTARNQYAALGQVQDAAVLWGGTAGGTANARTIALTPAISAYAAGQVFRFLNGAAANTGAATLAVNGLAATDIRKGATGAAALEADDLPANALLEVVYDGSVFRLLSVVGAATVTAPIPRALGVGQFANISVAAPNNVVLPAGGVWAYSIAQYVSGVFNNQATNIAAGGTTVLTGGSGISFGGFAWRIA